MACGLPPWKKIEQLVPLSSIRRTCSGQAAITNASADVLPVN